MKKNIKITTTPILLLLLPNSLLNSPDYPITHHPHCHHHLRALSSSTGSSEFGHYKLTSYLEIGLFDDHTERPLLAGSLIAQDNPEVQEVDVAAQLLFKLLEEFYSVRETRKHRDCFYRSFVFSYMEHIFETQDRREVDRMLAILRKYAKRNTVLAGNVLHFRDFFEDFRILLSTYSKGKRSAERLITAIEVHMWRTAYPEVVLGEKYSNLVEFCTGEVLPIGNKHVHAAVLSEALGVPIRVVDLTPAPPSSSERSTEDIPYYTAANTGSGSASSPTATRKRAMARFEITLLYKPDNCYDILYPFPEVTCCGYPIPDELISYWGLDR
ncbi:Ubiquitin thioesterase otubain-like [Ananas comosus]|uniref:Ubiquitin thioesterase otubain-like n=1 Tax=Ananas comosus TaxID=4615 RepID=A0A199USV8_ANACO|nr:Ubiquitin thioesterase otubain-like [Ananas comosus]